jgi:sec-independent protein translocase protein TatB
MEFLGVGPSELVFVILIAIIILGPKDMQKAGRTIGRWLNQLIRSDSWKVFQKTSAELRNLPRNWMREANMELQEVDKEIRQTIDPRSRPPMPPTLPADPPPATEPSTDAASTSNTPPQNSTPEPPASDQVQADSQPPTMNPTDVNGEIKQNG